MQLDSFEERYHRALDDAQLRQTLLTFQRKWRVTRDDALPDEQFEAVRQRLRVTKDAVIDELPVYLRQFTTAAQAAGAQVHSASSAQDAIEIVLAIALGRGARTVVKSKSMVSEEIDLNRGLEEAGLQVVETDLGEWIIQLAGERPSHIIAPAIHKNRGQIADLFHAVTGEPVSREDIGEQVQVARRRLRQEFLRGDIGISGANAIIAETGSIMLVTNEGNAELVTSVPPVHVVLVGMEKILPTLDDAMLQLQLLAPSATGQQATAYVTFITGPDAPDRELHIVILDNGRSAMRTSPLFRDALRCIRCGACSTICPSYGVVGGHVFGYVYSGAIGLVNTPFHNGMEHDVGPQSLCVQCNACQTVCPVDIPLPRQILDVRAWAAREGGSSFMETAALQLWSESRLAWAALRVASKLQTPIRRGKFIRPPGLGTLTSWRSLPALASIPFRDKPATESTPPTDALGRTLEGVTVAFFVQCLTDWLYPEMGRAVTSVLRRLGATVIFPRAQHCCGLPALDAGHPAIARRMAKQTIRVLEGSSADYVVTGGTSCAVAMLHEYEHLFLGEPEWQMRAALLRQRVMDFTTFMASVARLPEGSLASPRRQAATYHYFCQAHNVLGMRSEPLELLGAVCGLALTPLPEANVCCGFGGSVSFQRPEMCKHILERKLDNVDATGAPLLVTDNPGCILHLRGGINASGRHVRVLHTAEVVAHCIAVLPSQDSA